eukprot:1142973-Pelagomonas_calceolata.AAC.1
MDSKSSTVTQFGTVGGQNWRLGGRKVGVLLDALSELLPPPSPAPLPPTPPLTQTTGLLRLNTRTTLKPPSPSDAHSSVLAIPILDFITGLLASGRVTVRAPLALRLLQHVALPPPGSCLPMLASDRGLQQQQQPGSA